MLNTEKIKLMTQLSIFEKNKGKNDIPISKYYKSDYIRYNLLKTIVSVTIGYVLILFLAVMYNLEYLIIQAVSLDYKAIGSQVLRIYLLIMGIYLSLSIIISTIEYEKTRKRLRGYYKTLKKLKEIYRMKETVAEERRNFKDDDITGI